jgi:3-phenylpropionate/trans-cinnamate dioxygenase ferredoxin component
MTAGNWIDACAVDDVDPEDVFPVELGGRPCAIIRSPTGEYYAIDGLCTHEHVQLADGLVMGHVIECPKHNGQFDYTTGQVLRNPVRENLRTYPVKVESGRVLVELG